MEWLAGMYETGRIALEEVDGHRWFHVVNPPELRLLNALPGLLR